MRDKIIIKLKYTATGIIVVAYSSLARTTREYDTACVDWTGVERHEKMNITNKAKMRRRRREETKREDCLCSGLV